MDSPRLAGSPHAVERASRRSHRTTYKLAAFALFTFIVATFSLTEANVLRFVGIVLGICFVIIIMKFRLVPAPEALLYAAWAMWSFIPYFDIAHTELFVQSYRVVLQMAALVLSVSTLTRYLGTPVVGLAAVVVGAIVSMSYAMVEGDFSAAAALDGERVSGLLGNANGFGYQMLLALMSVAMLWGTVRSRRFRYLLIAATPLLLTALISSGSRKNFIGFMVFLVLWIVFPLRRRYRFKLRALLTSGIILIGAIFLYDFVMSRTIVGHRFHQDFDNYSSEEMRELDRIEYYIFGMEVIASNPILGIGFGNFRFINPTGQDSHSDYIEVISSTGIPGGIIYFFIYIVLWRRLKRAGRLASGYDYLIGCSRVSILAVLLVSLGMPQFSAPVHWGFMGILIGTAHYQLTGNRFGINGTVCGTVAAS